MVFGSCLINRVTTFSREKPRVSRFLCGQMTSMARRSSSVRRAAAYEARHSEETCSAPISIERLCGSLNPQVLLRSIEASLPIPLYTTVPSQ